MQLTINNKPSITDSHLQVTYSSKFVKTFISIYREYRC